METLHFGFLSSANLRFASKKQAANASILLVASLLFATSVAQAQCGSNPDFIVEPDGSGTPEIVFVIDFTVEGTGGDGIGNILIGAADGSVTQTQTLQITETGHVFPNNFDPCGGPANSAGVFIEKTGILDMQGGSLDAINLMIGGPAQGDAALGGILRGFGTVKMAGTTFAAGFDLSQATLHPNAGILNLDASRTVNNAVVEDDILLNNSTFRVMIGDSNASFLNIVKGNLSFTNTKLVVDFPTGFTATPGQQFTLVKFTGGTRSGLLSNAAGTALNEGATVTVNGVALNISYLGGTSGKDIVLKKEAPITIAVNDPLAVSEGSAATPGSVTFNVTLSAASTQTVTVNFQTANSTATAGSDYVAKSGTLTFTPGQTTKPVTVNFVGDSAIESDETFFLDLTTPTNATIADTRGIATIDNDDLPALTIANATVTESSTATANFVITLSPASPQTVTVIFATANGTATAGSDYNAASRTLTFSPGQTSKTVGVTVLADAVAEPNETFTAKLSNATNATLPAPTATGTIIDNNITVVVNNPRSLPEGNVGSSGSVTFDISLNTASTQTVTVNFATANGINNPAIAGTDYVAKSGKLTFAPGETLKRVTIQFIGDSTVELNETFFFDLLTPTNATIADSRGVGQINNDDGPGISIANAVTLDEGNSGTKNQTFTVSLSAASSDTVTVDWTTVSSTAGAADFVANSETLTFAPGQTSKLITIQIKGDTIVEPNETYKVVLSKVTFASIADGTGVGTIRNDDIATLLFENDQPSE